MESRPSSNEGASGLPQWLNANDRHARRDVRTLFPEDGLGDGSGASYSQRSQAGAAGDCQYVNFPLVRDQNGDCIPFYTAGRRSNSNTSSSSHGSHRLTDLFDFESQLDNVEGNDWVTGSDHPYGIPSTLLGGVLLNLDNSLRLSSNAEWQNWSDFLTSAQEPPDNHGDGARTVSGTYDSMLGAMSNRSSNASGAASTHSDELNNSLNNENTSNDIQNGEISSEDVSELLPNLPFPRGRFFHNGGILNRHMALPPPPSSSSSTRSSGSGSTGRPRQQEWYFYDPRLVSEQRTERVTLETSFRGLRNRCFMSSIIQPPAYDDIIQTDDVTGAAGTVEVDPPPPYTETEPSQEAEPPPSYDQSFGHTLALPTFNIGLPVNPLERRLAASLCTSPLVMSIPMPEPDLLTDVNIDELLEGPLGERVEINMENSTEPGMCNLWRLQSRIRVQCCNGVYHTEEIQLFLLTISYKHVCVIYIIGCAIMYLYTCMMRTPYLTPCVIAFQ